MYLICHNLTGIEICTSLHTADPAKVTITSNTTSEGRILNVSPIRKI